VKLEHLTPTVDRPVDKLWKTGGDYVEKPVDSLCILLGKASA
jgi:hypothetical protein